MSRFCLECGSKLPENAKFCPECGTPVAAPAPVNTEVAALSADGSASLHREERYDVFLSYSHKDRDKFGMEYILRIKVEIEKSLETIITDHKPRVFLDAEALQLGDHWHSKIMESLNQCKAVVCLVSEEYLKSEYCTRERLWWNAIQTQAGRFLDGPYPVYFVKLEKGIFSERREVKEMMAVQTDPLPWFEVKEKLQEEFIRERLAAISTAVRDKVSAAKQAEKSFRSVLPTLNKNFVGRIAELLELHNCCSEGRFPVIQAAGGVGKTELSVAYAYGFADQYPMGCFLFRMERVTSWDEAFAKALEMEGSDAQNIPKKVSEELNIDDELLEKKDPAELHRAAAKALLERAAKGKLLILLDNLDEDTTLVRKMQGFLCNSPISKNIHILATTRGTFNFSEREKFRSYELKNLKEDEAFEMLCLTGNGKYPFDKQPPSGENREYQSAHEVIRFLEGHAWSMEIVSAFMADNYDPEGFNFAMELDALRKNLILSSESGVTYRAGESSATSVELLRPTLERLATLELGAETLELAVFAACFDPDEIPLYLLREYWDRNFPDVACSKGVPFIYAVNQLVKYHLLRKDNDFCKMHRLVQAVFLSHKEKYLPRIRKTLEASLCIPAKYWIPILLRIPELIDVCFGTGVMDSSVWAKLLDDPIFEEKCPWDSFDGRDWARVLCEQPRFADRCDWNKLDGGAWSTLLGRQPQFAPRCDWSKLRNWSFAFLFAEQSQLVDSCKCAWEKMLDGGAWSSLLREQPRFADRCDWNKLDGRDWAYLISRRPELAEDYPCDWNTLDGKAWAVLLSFQPQFERFCNWSKLDGRDWGILLSRQARFAVLAPWSTLTPYDWARILGEQPGFPEIRRCPWSGFNGGAWATLLSSRPEFADRCAWHKLEGDDWARLLCHRPEFAAKCPWDKLAGGDWAYLLKEHPEWYSKIDISLLDASGLAELIGSFPQFAKRCDLDILDGDTWGRLLVRNPQFAGQCPWDKLDGENWAGLLEEQPQLGGYCAWDKLDGENWAGLLKEQPQFADRCAWDKLDASDWGTLLESQPQFEDRCRYWDEFDGVEWSDLLCEQPQFEDRCRCWDELGDDSWRNLLESQPRFADKRDWSSLTGADWAAFLARLPQFADRCDWSKLKGADWAKLLVRQPQFADRCQCWEKLDVPSWIRLLTVRPQFADRCRRWNRLDVPSWVKLLVRHPQLADRCRLWDDLDGEDWSYLLSKQPDLADRCDWSRLDGTDWRKLLIPRPEFENTCAWEKMDVVDWVNLLADQPRFAPRFECWDRLKGDAWSYLLSRRPDLADHCDWSLLDGGDWARLLAEQPQFAEHCDWSKLDGDDWDDLLTEQPQFADRCDRGKFAEDDFDCEEDGLESDLDEEDPDLKLLILKIKKKIKKKTQSENMTQ